MMIITVMVLDTVGEISSFSSAMPLSVSPLHSLLFSGGPQRVQSVCTYAVIIERQLQKPICFVFVKTKAVYNRLL